MGIRYGGGKVMEKLTVEILSNYLPYALQAEMLDYKNDNVNKQFDTVVGLHQWDKNGQFWSVLTVGGSKPSLDKIRPILRPITSFTNEEWKEIFISCCQKLESKSEHLQVYISRRSIRLCDSSTGMGIFYSKKTIFKFSIGKNGISNEFGYAFDYEKFFKEIYKRHGDLNYLIKDGIAINYYNHVKEVAND